MYIDLPEKKYRVLYGGNKGEHGNVRVLMKDGKECDTEVVVTKDTIKADQLRRGASKSERRIAEYLLERGFKHSYPVLSFYLDFYHPGLKFCVEVDGPVHKYRTQKDKDRDTSLWVNCKIVTRRYPSHWAYGDPASLAKWIDRFIYKCWKNKA